jgi:glycosyltransferase involved in cell wall biosynthesis
MRICLVASGLSERNRRLQPWRYLLATARGLAERGHRVVLLTDRASGLAADGTLEGLPLCTCGGTRWPDRDALELARSLRTEALLWHVGLSSFTAPALVPCVSGGTPPIIGILTSPLYRPRELLRLGLGPLCRAPRLSAAHLLGLLVPDGAICRALHVGWLCSLVVECESTRARLLDRGVAADRAHVIRPAIDPLWFGTRLDPDERREVRGAMGYADEDLLIGTFGPAAPLRGLPDLLSAVAEARAERPDLRLLAFCRQRAERRKWPGEALDARALARQVARLGAEEWARLVSGWTAPAVLARSLAACDLIALPFRLLSSDVPLSVLEAMALGRPVIVTGVGCLPELVPRGTGLVVPPAGHDALRLGAAARARAARWQADRGGAKWDQLLESAAEHALSTWPGQTGPARAPRHVH